MKIKYLRPFRLYNPIGDAFIRDEGTVEDMGKDDYAQWLIDNGFAEEVKESDWWKPEEGDTYYFIDEDGYSRAVYWQDYDWEVNRFVMGNCFKTWNAAERYRDYLKAVATVRQDEGVLTTQEANKQCDNGNRVYCVMPQGTVRNTISVVAPGGIYFKDVESAGASLDKHLDEWKIITNYDWSRE